MTQFEFDQLMILAGAWTILAETKNEPERKAYKRCASELRDLLRRADTSPDDLADESYAVPTMKNPDHLPKIEEA